MSNDGVLLNGRTHRVRHVRVVEKQGVIPIRDKNGKAYKGYAPGGNAFADIWRMPNGGWKAVVVSTFEFNQPDFAIERFRPHPAAKRLMRVHIDDMGALGEGPNRRIVRVRKIADNAKQGGLVVLDDHNEANVPDRIKKDAKKEEGHGRACRDERGRVLGSKAP